MQTIYPTEAAARPLGLPRRPSRYKGAGRAVVVAWALLATVAWVFPAAAQQQQTLIGELFGANRGRPDYQVGVRSVLIPDRLHFDLSWGGHTARDLSGVGGAFGLAWTPPPIARTPSAARCTHGPAERSDRC